MVKPRRNDRKRLFLPIKNPKDIFPATISRWICDVALPSSWAYRNSLTLEDVVRAAYWRTDSSFVSFYLRDIDPIRSDNSALGPIVASQ